MFCFSNFNFDYFNQALCVKVQHTTVPWTISFYIVADSVLLQKLKTRYDLSSLCCKVLNKTSWGKLNRLLHL